MPWDTGAPVLVTGEDFIGAWRLEGGDAARDGDLNRRLNGGTLKVRGLLRVNDAGVTAVKVGVETQDVLRAATAVSLYTVPPPALDTWTTFEGWITPGADQVWGRPHIAVEGAGEVDFAEVFVQRGQVHVPPGSIGGPELDSAITDQIDAATAGVADLVLTYGDTVAAAVSAAAADAARIAAELAESAAAIAAADALAEATAAALSATGASGSATTAAGHSSTALTRANAADASAVAAAASATAAASSNAAAGTSAGAAATSASSAATQAGAAGASASAASSSATTASTQAGLAATQASAASASAATASAEASAASQSATVAASAGVRSLNKNPTFNDYPTTTGVPTNWTNNSNGSGTRITGETGLYAYQLNGGAGAAASIYGDGIAGGIVQNAWFVIEAHVKLLSGALTGAGVTLRALTSGGATAQDLTLAFATDASSTGAVVGAGTTGKTYRFAKLVQVTAATADKARLFVASHNSALGSIAGANQIAWFAAFVRPATDQEIASNTATSNVAALTASVATHATALSDIDGRLAATWGVQLNVGGRVQGLKYQQYGGGGTVVSTFDVEADVFRIWNGTSNTPAFEVSGGAVYVAGNKVRTQSAVDNAFTLFESQYSPSGYGGFGTRDISYSTSTGSACTLIDFFTVSVSGEGSVTVQWAGVVQWTRNVGVHVDIWLYRDSTQMGKQTHNGNANNMTSTVVMGGDVTLTAGSHTFYVYARCQESGSPVPYLDVGAQFLVWEGKK